MPGPEHGEAAQRRRARSHHEPDEADLPRRPPETSHHKLLQVAQPRRLRVRGRRPWYLVTTAAGLVLAVAWRDDVDVKGLEGRRHLQEAADLRGVPGRGHVGDQQPPQVRQEEFSRRRGARRHDPSVRPGEADDEAPCARGVLNEPVEVQLEDPA
ncbi:hypothetical protein PVAP13_3KG053727 [Panicum virgatum]|uniref:Uncharacterized protein n=1 Tax=Panicum virgatum TaxID=38727 RepID=A0A8T0ULA6_PANVG|nr:hypothetical protein PVAP13_3KG053727 [Panicum virgatum]